jgi:hypothetical protein
MLFVVHGIDNLRSEFSSMPSLGHLYIFFHKTHGKVMLSHTINEVMLIFSNAIDVTQEN